jgi:two-component system KDP operon response regulator KdpE
LTYVLVAEDDPAVATVIEEAIRDRLQASAETIANGALIVDSIAAHRPDLLILDVGLPGLNGLDVSELVRNDPANDDIPVLFLTASPEKAETARGDHQIIAKPFDIDELVGTIGRLVEGRTEPAAA